MLNNMELSDLDRKILFHLVENSRQPVYKLARQVGATRQTVAKRIEQLKKSNVIKSFSVVLEPEDFNLKIKAFIFLKEDPDGKLRRKHAEIIKGWPQVLEFHRIFGRSDSIVEILVKDNDELTKIVKRLHRLKGVKSTETFIVHTTLKYKPGDPFILALSK